MKYILTIVFSLFCLFAHAVIIEDKEPGLLEVIYTKTTAGDTLKWRTHSDPITLRIGKTCAMFYPPKRMWADSLLRTNFELHEKLYREANPIGKPAMNPIGGLEREFLFRNVHDGETMVCQSIAGDYYYYTEPTEQPDWELKQEYKEIFGYQCQLAVCDFRGRKWSAWFTPEIPIHEGPWKLFGLPGLVLEAYDSKKHFLYEVAGIMTDDILPVGIKLYVRDQPYNIKSRTKYLQKIFRESIKGRFVARMSITFGNGSQSKPQEAQRDSQETDYPHE